MRRNWVWPVSNDLQGTGGIAAFVYQSRTVKGGGIAPFNVVILQHSRAAVLVVRICDWVGFLVSGSMQSRSLRAEPPPTVKRGNSFRSSAGRRVSRRGRSAGRMLTVA
jgi:hypothetical protein